MWSAISRPGWAMKRALLLSGLIFVSLREAAAQELQKFEPAQGCYIGAFIEKDDVVRGDIALFEKLAGKKHASYFTYVGYGQPFPTAWVGKVKAAGAVPHIAWEPNDGLDNVRDNRYLREWARQAADAECPIFLRFASEMNGSWSAYSGNPKLYIEKWRLVANVMRKEAPNVAMLWAPFCMPANNIHDYYPGDDCVDWVGINIYSVYCHNGDPKQLSFNEDPVKFLRLVYDVYADRKPIAISEYAATHFCKGTSKDTTEFAIEKMTRMYEALRKEFPRVKMINWLSFDTIKWGVADNNYCLTVNEKMLTAYRSLVSADHFLSDIPFVIPSPLPRIKLTSLKPSLPLSADDDALPSLEPFTLDIRNPASNPKLPFVASMQGRRVSAEHILLAGITDGSYLSRRTVVRVIPLNGDRIRFATFKLNGRVFKFTNVPPFSVVLDPAKLSSGEHQLEVKVTLASGKEVALPPATVETGGDG